MSVYLENVVPARGYRLAVIGTSLVQHNEVGTSSPKISHWSRGWLSWARFYAGRLFSCPIWWDSTAYVGWEPSGTPGATRYFQGLNAGVSGQTYAQIEARKSYLSTKVDCDIVVIDDGTNDMSPETKENIQAARESLASYYLSFGKIVILMPILARGVSSWSGGSAERAKANWINRKTREFCRTKKNCYFFDWNLYWVDFASTYGEPKSGYSPDAIHFNPKGGEAVGYGFSQFLATILPTAQNFAAYPDDLFDATNNPMGNRLANPLCLGTGGTLGTGATGSVANSMRVERSTGGSSVVASKESRSDGLGEYQVMTFTPGGAAEDLFYFRTNTANTALTGAVAGDWFTARCKIETNNYSGFTGVALLLSDQGTGSMDAYAMEPFNSGSANEKWTALARAGYLETPPFQIADTAPNVRWRLEITFDANVAGTPIVKAGEIELRQVTNPQTLLNWSAPV